MRLEALELRRVAMPLRSPYRVSFGTLHDRDVLVVRAVFDDGVGWGECAALPEPNYSSEYIDGAWQVIEHHLGPRLFGSSTLDASSVAGLLGDVSGHRMAKAALEMATLDAELRIAGMSLASHLGGVRETVDVGVSLGIVDSTEELLARVESFVACGYRRVKLKIQPGWDLEPVRAVRERIGDDVLLQVDANAAYTIEQAGTLAALDGYGLLLIEQPFAEDDLLAHAELARRISTPVCLDESITSERTAVQAIEIGACSIVNIKAGRVGGLLEAKRIHDACAERGVPVWCGGMHEAGLGRAANVALSSLPNFTIPGDSAASERYFHRDITEPFVLEDGRLRVPTGAGLGVEPIPGILDELTTAMCLLRP